MPRDLQWLLDLEEIRQLRIAYCWAFENNDADGVADLFTEDGVVDVRPWGYMKNQRAIRKGYGNTFANAEPWGGFHAVTNPRIEIDGDTARGCWYLLDIAAHGVGINPLGLLGLYVDEYRRESGVWKITHMTVDTKWTSQLGRVDENNPMVVPTRTDGTS